MKKKLQFTVETIRALTQIDLSHVAGGGMGCTKGISGCSTKNPEGDNNCVNKESDVYCTERGCIGSRVTVC